MTVVGQCRMPESGPAQAGLGVQTQRQAQDEHALEFLRVLPQQQSGQAVLLKQRVRGQFNRRGEPAQVLVLHLRCPGQQVGRRRQTCALFGQRQGSGLE